MIRYGSVRRIVNRLDNNPSYMSLIPTEDGINALIGLSTGLFFVLVASTVLVRLFWGMSVRDSAGPKPTFVKSLLVSVSGGFLVLPFFLAHETFAVKPSEKKPVEIRRSFSMTDEEDRARRSGIESLRNYLFILDRGKKNEISLPHGTRFRSREVWTIPYASGMCYTYFPDENTGPYLAVEPEILDGKRYGIERKTFAVVELADGETK